MRKLRSSRVALSAAFVGLAASMTSCSSEPEQTEDNVFYCVDESETIVNEDNCDDDVNRSHYLAYGALPLGMLIGSRLPLGTRRFPASDKAMRTSFGLPDTGRVSNGTVKTGVIGKGGNSGVTSGS